MKRLTIQQYGIPWMASSKSVDGWSMPQDTVQTAADPGVVGGILRVAVCAAVCETTSPPKNWLGIIYECAKNLSVGLIASANTFGVFVKICTYVRCRRIFRTLRRPGCINTGKDDGKQGESDRLPNPRRCAS